MDHGNRLVICVLAVLSLWVAMTGSVAWAAQADFYVASNGDDAWSGALARPNAERTDGPFATLERARDAIRRLKAGRALSKPVTVMVRGGTYFLSKPFVLRPEDSGGERCPVTYLAYPGEKPVLSKAVPPSSSRATSSTTRGTAGSASTSVASPTSSATTSSRWVKRRSGLATATHRPARPCRSTAT